MEPTIYKPGVYNAPTIYNKSKSIYNSDTIYKNGGSNPKPLIINIGGVDYPYVEIGGKKWLAQNLDYLFGGSSWLGKNGAPQTEAYWYYDNDSSYSALKYGLLYNWYAAHYLEQQKNNLLPIGWRVPTKADYNKLLADVGGWSDAGTMLKDDSFGGTNDYGFNAIGAGDRNTLLNPPSFTGSGTFESFITITESSNTINCEFFGMWDSYAYSVNITTLKTCAGALRLICD